VARKDERPVAIQLADDVDLAELAELFFANRNLVAGKGRMDLYQEAGTVEDGLPLLRLQPDPLLTGEDLHRDPRVFAASVGRRGRRLPNPLTPRRHDLVKLGVGQSSPVRGEDRGQSDERQAESQWLHFFPFWSNPGRSPRRSDNTTLY
jgi:hypothetical protein